MVRYLPHKYHLPVKIILVTIATNTYVLLGISEIPETTFYMNASNLTTLEVTPIWWVGETKADRGDVFLPEAALLVGGRAGIHTWGAWLQSLSGP